MDIQTILITCLPSLTAIISIITAVSTILKSLAQLKDNEAIKAERDALKEQNEKFMLELKKTNKMMRLFVQKCAHTAFENLTEVQNDKDLQN